MDELYSHQFDTDSNPHNLNWEYDILVWDNSTWDNNSKTISGYVLVEYMARNRNRFLVIMDNMSGDIVCVAKKNGPLTICNRQKHLIEWVIRRGNFERFSQFPSNNTTEILIQQIQDNVAKKLLWNIKHPEISGTFLYKNSKNQTLLVQVQNGKVLSVEPEEYNFAQQKWAIQKKLNQMGNDAFIEECSHGKALYELAVLLHQHEKELIETIPRQDDERKQYIIKMSGILWEIFNCIHSNFPDIEIDYEHDGENIHHCIRSLHRLLHKTQINYPLMYTKCEFIKTMINNVKGILISFK